MHNPLLGLVLVPEPPHHNSPLATTYPSRLSHFTLNGLFKRYVLSVVTIHAILGSQDRITISIIFITCYDSQKIFSSISRARAVGIHGNIISAGG